MSERYTNYAFAALQQFLAELKSHGDQTRGADYWAVIHSLEAALTPPQPPEDSSK